ncbi:MAG: hydantoinase/oxoprolinase family protein [Thermodesulfobacteriota bacterium]
MKLGVDTGGTFTDFVLEDEGSLRRYKVSSTPSDPSAAIISGVRHFFGEDIPPELEIVHGTTVGTNALLERKGARVLLVLTHGFRDILTIGRQARSRLYDLNYERPKPLIDQQFITTVKERVTFTGTVQRPLGSSVGRRLRALARELQAQAVVVCLLHSYANPCHERQLAEELAALKLPIILSSDILPEFREYERLTTTLINGYLAPIMAAYIQRLQDHLGSLPLSIQQSNGGILPAGRISRRAVHTVLSGPAGGVQGAWQLAGQLGRGRIITFDMGGTSTDVALCAGEPALTRDYHLDGFPLRIPLLDIHTVGAGGGSLVRLDQGGLLHVGPESAGADPGPVCYGQGETLSVTDANLFLGRLQPDYFLAGRMKLDLARTREHMAILAGKLGLTPEETALGIVRIVNAGMVKAVRAVSLERGHDPQEFSLFSFGGASGLHCCELARELAMGEIVIPARAGILSAQGMVFAEPVLDKSHSLFLRGKELTPSAIAPLRDDLFAQLSSELAGLNLSGEMEFSAHLDLRYAGQSHEIEVPLRDNDLLSAFHQAHATAFGYHLPEREVECVALRCRLRLARPSSPLPSAANAGREGGGRAGAFVPLVTEEGALSVPLLLRRKLAPGQGGQGPCLIVDDYTTILVTKYFSFKVDGFSNIILTARPER